MKCVCCELVVKVCVCVSGTNQVAVLVGDIGVHVLDHKSCTGADDMEK